jgi:hypothetical protein
MVAEQGYGSGLHRYWIVNDAVAESYGQTFTARLLIAQIADSVIISTTCYRQD